MREDIEPEDQRRLAELLDPVRVEPYTERELKFIMSFLTHDEASDLLKVMQKMKDKPTIH